MFSENRFLCASISLSIVASYFTWKYFLHLVYFKRDEYKKNQLHYEKHNSVIMYTDTHANGWPGWPNKMLNKSSCLSNKIVFEPILYFIATAERTLDIAMMMFHIKAINDEIIMAIKRGVVVRIICDHDKMSGRDSNTFRDKENITVRYYASPNPTKCSIFHYKFMVKDHTENGGGSAYIGSMNWTINGFYHNFEDIVLTTNKYIVDKLQQEFIKSWNYVQHISADRFHELH